MRLESLTLLEFLYIISQINLSYSEIQVCVDCNDRPSSERTSTVNQDIKYDRRFNENPSLNDEAFSRSIYASLMKILNSMRDQIKGNINLERMIQDEKDGSDIGPILGQNQWSNFAKRSDEKFRDDQDPIVFGRKVNDTMTSIISLEQHQQQQQQHQLPQSSSQQSREPVIINVSSEPIVHHPHNQSPSIATNDYTRPMLRVVSQKKQAHGEQLVEKSHQHKLTRPQSYPYSLKFTPKDAQPIPIESNDQPLFIISTESQNENELAQDSLDPEQQRLDLLRQQKQRLEMIPSPVINEQTVPKIYEVSSKGTMKPVSIIPVSNRRPMRQVNTLAQSKVVPVNYATRLVRYNDHLSSSSGDSAGYEEDEIEYGRRPVKQSETQDGINNQATQSSYQSHQGIILQQITPGERPSSSQASSNPRHSSVPQQLATNVYGLTSSSPGGLKFLTKNDFINTPSNQQQQIVHDISNNQRYPNDLQNQPQTIQVTALPNAAPFNPLAQLIRLNGPLALSNQWNGLLPNYGLSTDAFGRPVLMLNAERRGLEWPTWFYPMILVVTLPLIVGALFVPLFLKTIIVLLQILQSLGLLLPLTNAMSQQILQATGFNNKTLIGIDMKDKL